MNTKKVTFVILIAHTVMHIDCNDNKRYMLVAQQDPEQGLTPPRHHLLDNSFSSSTESLPDRWSDEFSVSQSTIFIQRADSPSLTQKILTRLKWPVISVGAAGLGVGSYFLITYLMHVNTYLLGIRTSLDALTSDVDQLTNITELILKKLSSL